MNYHQWKAYLWSILLIINTASVEAQVISDDTLPSNTQIKIEGSNYYINLGTRAGDNLFHSFSEFNINIGEAIIFNNSLDITNIFTRITGNNPSNIDGLLQVQGGANLFLINPNGIVFGENARLDIQGSFLSSTADSIVFADSSEFSASNPNPVLTVSVPIGLNFSDNRAIIEVRDSGYYIEQGSAGSRISVIAPFVKGSYQGLQVSSGKNLVLLGNQVKFDNGIAVAEQGHIEIGAVREGLVLFDITQSNWQFNYQNVREFDDITLSSLSLLDVSGLQAGSINVIGDNILLEDGGFILSQNLGDGSGGDIILTANSIELERLSLDFNNPLLVKRSNITTENIGLGRGSNIQIFSNELIVNDGAIIGSRNFNPLGRGGDINIHSNSVKVLGFAREFLPFISLESVSLLISGISSVGNSNSGRVTVNASDILLADGGIISNTTIGSGEGTSLDIQAENIRLAGFIPNVFQVSQITTASFGSGNAGNLTINAKTISLENGGRISSAGFSDGNAGNLIINVSNQLSLDGFVPNSINPTLIDSSINNVDPSQKIIFQLPEVPSGNAGSIEINTPKLIISNGAAISVRNDGIGDAGTIGITSDLININNAQISATTILGNGGNIEINSNFLKVENGQITTNSQQQGDGGRISLVTDSLLGLSSTISANAFEGDGGKVSIVTEGFFLSPDSKITANSAFGEEGTIDITVLDDSVKNTLERTLVNRNPLGNITTNSCFDPNYRNRGRFKIVGSGIPSSPTNTIDDFADANSVEAEMPIVVGEDLVTTEDGQLLLVARNNPETIKSLTCQ